MRGAEPRSPQDCGVARPAAVKAVERAHNVDRINSRGSRGMPRILLLRGPLVRPRQPVAEQAGRFIGRAAVKRHERRRHARNPHDVGAPSILGHRLHFDQVRASSDGFFEAMNGRGHVCGETKRCVVVKGKFGFYASARVDQAKQTSKRRPQTNGRESSLGGGAQKKFGCRSMHRKFTVRPQFLHRACLDWLTRPPYP